MFHRFRYPIRAAQSSSMRHFRFPRQQPLPFKTYIEIFETGLSLRFPLQRWSNFLEEGSYIYSSCCINRILEALNRRKHARPAPFCRRGGGKKLRNSSQLTIFSSL